MTLKLLVQFFYHLWQFQINFVRREVFITQRVLDFGSLRCGVIKWWTRFDQSRTGAEHLSIYATNKKSMAWCIGIYATTLFKLEVRVILEKWDSCHLKFCVDVILSYAPQKVLMSQWEAIYEELQAAVAKFILSEMVLTCVDVNGRIDQDSHCYE